MNRNITLLLAFFALIALQVSMLSGTSSANNIDILNVSIQPSKVNPGDTMIVSANISDVYGVSSVYADMGGIETIPLYLNSGTIYKGMWQNTWLVHDTESRNYTTNISVISRSGLSSYALAEWSDPPCSISCDSTVGNTCIISSPKEVEGGCTIDDTVIGVQNLEIQNGGSIYNTTNTEGFIIDLTGNITIKNGGNITGNVNITASNVFIESGGKLSSDYVGYGSGQGPGAGVSDNWRATGGGGYGGAGGRGYNTNGGSSYGSMTQPLDFGSGGGTDTEGSPVYGGSGGGRIIINLTGTLALNGTLSSSGENGYVGTYGSGGGSGGSVYIITNKVEGTGIIKANGGAGGNDADGLFDGGGGAGGRIALYASNFSFSGTIEAKGNTGNDGAQSGYGGTIYINATTYFEPTSNFLANSTDSARLGTIVFNYPATGNSDSVLLYSNNPVINPIPWFSDSMNIGCSDGSECTVYRVKTNLTGTHNYASLNITKNASLHASVSSLALTQNLTVSLGGLLDFSSDANITADNIAITDGGNISYSSNLDINAPSIYVSEGSSIIASAKLANLTINASVIDVYGTINANANITAENVTIYSTGKLSSDYVGYSGGTPQNNNAQGPGAGSYGYLGGGGAGYGGNGGNGYQGAGGSSYGSLTQPLDFGSGGGSSWYSAGGSGGGRIIINLTGTLTINGNISSSGENGNIVAYGAGGGSGGSVYVIADIIEGTGTIRANGGAGGNDADGLFDGGGGAGGRIALYASNFSFSGTIEAKGNTGNDGAQSGYGGTIYINATGNFNISSGTILANSTDSARLGSANITYGSTGWEYCDAYNSVFEPSPAFYFVPYSATTPYRCVKLVLTNFTLRKDDNSTSDTFKLNESIYLSFRVREFNGTDYWNVTDGSWNISANETLNPNSSTFHISGGYWKSIGSFSKNMGGYYFVAENITGESPAGMKTRVNDIILQYSVKSIITSLELNSSVVRPSDVMRVSGHATLKPDETDVANNLIHIYLDGSELLYNASTGFISEDGNETLATDSNGNYDYNFIAPSSIGTHEIKVNLTDSNGIYSENYTTFEAGGNPKWSANATKFSSPQIYDAGKTYGFQINWTDPTNNFANATFQLGRPDGTLTNYTIATTPAVQNISDTWYINFTQAQIGGTGAYNYTWFGINKYSNQNSTDTLGYVISISSNPINIYFRNETGEYNNKNITVVYESYTNTTAVNVYENSGVLNIYRNDEIANSENNTMIVLPEGLHKITANTSGNENYTSNATTYYIRVLQKDVLVRLFINDTESDVTIYTPNITNLTATVNTNTLVYIDANFSGTNKQISSGMGSAENITNISNLEKGVYNITAYVKDTQNYTGTLSQTYYLTVRGRLNITIDTPQPGSVFNRTYAYWLNASVTDDSGHVVEGADVNWYVDDVFVNNSQNSRWTVPASQPTGIATIKVNATKEYFDNVAEDSVQIEIWRTLTLYLNISPEEIYRNDSFSPHITTYTANVTDENGPVSSAQVRFWRGTTFIGLNSTNSDGTTQKTDNVFDSETPGTYTVYANITFFADAYSHKINGTANLTVKGLLFSAITSVSNNSKYYKNDTLNLQSTTVDENGATQVPDAAIWYLNGLEILSGESGAYQIPINQTLGYNLLNYTATKQYYEPSSQNKTLQIWSFAAVNQTDQNIVYRGNSANYTGFVYDFINNSIIPSYNCIWYNNGTNIENSTTNSTGHCTYSFSTSCSNTPGLYIINVSILNNTQLWYDAKQGFESYAINLNVTGNLSVQIDTPSNGLIYNKGDGVPLTSTIKDECSNIQTSNVYWYANGSQISTGEDTTWDIPFSQELGFTVIEANATKEYYKYGRNSTNILIYGWSNNTRIYGAGSYPAGSVINVSCLIEDANTSAPILDYPVNFYKNNSLILTNLTNSEGYAYWFWDTTSENAGIYNISCEISDNSTIFYNTSIGGKSETVEITRNLTIDQIIREYDTVYRFMYSPGQTMISVHVSEAALGDSSSSTVRFYNATDEFDSCITNSSGWCSITYNPDDTITPNNYTFWINASKGGFSDSQTNTTWVVVKGKVEVVNIINPSQNQKFHRTELVDMNAQEIDENGAYVYETLNWYNSSQEQIATGLNTNWTIPAHYKIGEETLKANVSSNYYDSSDSTVTINIYGWSNVSYVAPTGIQRYGDTLALNCSVRDANTSEYVNNYSVSFYENDSYIGSNFTEGGYAVVYWKPGLADYSLKCNITDNATLYYDASISQASQTISVHDLTKPYITNATLLYSWMEVGQNQTIRANVTDDVSIDTVWAAIDIPPWNESDNATYANLTMSFVEGNATNGFYELNYTPEKGGIYNVTIFANDTAGNTNYTFAGNFSVPRNTTGYVGQVQYMLITDVNSTGNKTIELNVSLINTGNTSMTSASITLVLPSGWNGDKTKECGTIPRFGNCTLHSNISIPAGTVQGNYSINSTGKWTNLDGSTAYNGNVPKNQTIINITDNPILNITTNNFSGTVGHGNESTLGIFSIQSLGNKGIYKIFFNKTSGNLSADWVEFISGSYINYLPSLNANQTKLINVSVTVPATEIGYFASEFIANATNSSCYPEENCYKRINVSVTVPEDRSWNITPHFQSVVVYQNTSGNLTNVTILNQGNLRIDYVIDKTGNASSLITLSDSFVSIENQSSHNLQINYSIPINQNIGKYYANITISNDSASPVQINFSLTLSVNDNILPVVNNTNLSATSIETNYNYINITADAFDNFAVDRVWANLTFPNSSTYKLFMHNISLNTYRVNFTPADSGLYNVSVFANDTSGNINSTYAGNFTAIGTTSGLNEQNPSSVTASGITQTNKYSFVLNATLTNTGSGTMRFVNYTLSLPSGFEANATYAQCANMSSGQTCLLYFAINVTADADIAVPHVKGNYTWQNPDYSISYADNSTYVTVSPNPVLNILETSINSSLGHGNSSTIGSFTIMSEGNKRLEVVDVASSGNMSSWISYIPPFPINFILKGLNKTINVSASVPLGQEPGVYEALLMTNATGSSCSPASNCWDNITVTLTVPEDWSWNATPRRIPSSGYVLVPTDTTGSFVVTLNNTGNVGINFTITQAENGASLIAFPPPTGYAVFVEKQNATNVTFTYDSHGVLGGNYILDIRIRNSSASPQEIHSYVYFNVQEVPPSIDNITVSPATLDQNYQSMLIQADVVDNIGVSDVWANITLPDSTHAILPMNNPGGGKTYNTTYIPAEAGTYTVVIYANDSASPSNENHSQAYYFTAVGSTAVSVVPNITKVEVPGVTQDNGATVPLNVSLNNLGQGTAYFANLTFDLFANWSASPSLINYNNISRSSSASNVSVISVPAAALGQYLINASATWNNPNNTIWTNKTIINITVLSNPQIDISQDIINITVKHGETNSTNFTINATGNDALSSVSITCQSGSICTNDTYFSYSFSQSSIANINAGANSNVTVTVSAALGTPPGVYVGIINASMNASGNMISDLVEIGVNVPSNSTWSMSQSWSGIKTVGTGASGTIGTLTITNYGNHPLLFNTSITGNGTSYMNLTQPNITVAGQSSGTLTLNYYSPMNLSDNASEISRIYSINISVENSSATPAQLYASAILKVMKFNVRILFPTSEINVTSGDNFSVNANATYGESIISDNITWTVKFNSTECPVFSSVTKTDSSNNYFWQINCTAPQLPDANNYTLYLYGNYTDSSKGIYGAITNDFKRNIIVYPDVSKAKIQSIVAPSVTPGNNVTINATLTDNVAVVEAIVQVTYPNNITENYTLSNTSWNLSAASWVYNFTNTSQVGDYDIRIYARDKEGNWNSSDSWFEVYRNNVTFTGVSETATDKIEFDFYRPGKVKPLYLVHAVSSNTTTGNYTAHVHNRTYDIKISQYGNSVKLISVPLTESVSNPIKLKDVSVTKVGSNILRVLAVSNNLSFSVANVTLNYSGKTGFTESALRVFKCGNWSYSSDSCPTTWSLVGGTLNGDNTITVNTTSFSAFALSKNSFICGDNYCDSANGETSANCPTDGCSTSTAGGTTGGGGTGTGSGTGSGSGGGGAAPVQQQPQINLTKLKQPDMEVSSNNLDVTLHPGETIITSIDIKNNLDRPVTAELAVGGRIWEFVQFENTSILMEPKSLNNVKIKFSAPETILPGIYTGDIFIKSGNKTQRISTTMKVVEKAEPLMDVKIETLTKEVNPGDFLRSQVTLYNMGMTKKIDVTLIYTIRDVYTSKIAVKDSETLAIENSLSFVRTIHIPKSVKPGKYAIEVVAYYDNKTATAVSSFDVVEMPVIVLFFISVLTSWQLYIFIAGVIVTLLIRRMIESVTTGRKKKSKYIFPVNFKKLPRKGIKVGKIAETDIDAYLDQNKLTTHLLLAGGTGSGKSVSAMVIAEECLKKGIPVIVFDPTAQWTGFIKPCRDERMLSLYPKFGMKREEARAFKGTIIDVTDPNISVDITKYLNKGEITVFNLNKMFASDLDSFVRKTIDNIFSVQWKEAHELKLLIVYDEVHRLLPKYGGKGGYVALERGAREFRKWGIGLIMISQVLLDFRGAVRAVIASEGQLRTKYEGDIKRVRTKYGSEYAATVPKLQVGTVLFQNPEYNDGKPWFISFRPLLHDTSRIPEEELQQYKLFNKKIEEMEKVIKELKSKKIDTYDLEIELKIAKEKVKQGQMRMAQTYIESIEARMKKMTKK